MRLVAISRVRNEADLVEAFIRHTATFVDLHLVLDNGSTDATPEVLRRLRTEGLPLIVGDDATPGYRQAEQTNRLMLEAARNEASWVIPLDCDEFLGVDDRDALEVALVDDTRPALIRWRTFVPDPSDDPAELNPVKRIRHHLRSEAHPWTKVMIPGKLVPHTVIEPGNHDVRVDRDDQGRQDLNGSVVLCHFPVRSIEQYAVKVAIGNLQYMALGGDRRGLGFHYEAPYQLLMEDWPAFAAGYFDAARRYAVYPHTKFDPDVVLEPMAYRGGPLRYTPPPRSSEPWRSILEYTAQIASRLGAPSLILDPD
jgi:hypothetical protein